MSIATECSSDLFIDGQFLSGGSGRFPTINPATEEIIQQYQQLGSSAIEQHIEQADQDGTGSGEASAHLSIHYVHRALTSRRGVRSSR